MAQAQREWFEKDYYKVLGVSSSATEKEITRAYRRLAKQYHPDANPGSEDRFKEISAAYDVLGDADKRREYDEVRRLGAARGAPGGNPFAGGGNFTSFRVEDFSDLLGGMFSRGAPPRGARTRSGPRRGANLDAELHLSFEEALKGIETTVNVTSDASCTTCSGTGAAPGSAPQVCHTCSGRGIVDDNQGLFSFSQPCRDCGGTGMRIDQPCPECAGSGVVHRPRRIKVRVPPGAEDGQRVRYKGKGGAGANGGPPGDLFVTFRVRAHSLFGRRGKDLTITVPITFAEAALGATITVPTFDAPVTLRIPPGTRSGRTFRVKGRGAPQSKGHGDLLVTVEVAVPQRLTDEEREAIEALAAASSDSPRKYLGV